ncbi:MAG: hypothetical protein ACYTEZ_14725 [Planctomycetota bacterium]|jgi:hypothetical protein
MRWLALLLLAAAAWAQGVPFDRTAIAMLPGVEDQARARLQRIHGATLKEVGQVHQRLRVIEAQLERKPGPAEAKKLRAEQAALQQRVVRLHRQLEQRTLEAGLLPAQLARLKRMPRGALREERYNHGVLLEVPDLTDDQQGLLRHLVAATDAAQSAIVAQKHHLGRGLAKTDPNLRRQLAATCDRQCREIEQRFWKAAYYTLTPDQMRAARPLFSPRYGAVPEHRRQFYLLPGLTPSQANRVQARFAELDSETAADHAGMRRIRTQLKDRRLSQADRQALHRRSAQANRRVQELVRHTRAALFADLTPEQRAAYRALPPQLSIGARTQPPWQVSGALHLRQEQRARVRELQQQVNLGRQQVRKEHRADYDRLMQAGLGPESPQMMRMEMMRQGSRAKTSRHHQVAGHRLFVEVLDPDQVARWVVAPPLESAGRR